MFLHSHALMNPYEHYSAPSGEASDVSKDNGLARLAPFPEEHLLKKHSLLLVESTYIVLSGERKR